MQPRPPLLSSEINYETLKLLPDGLVPPRSRFPCLSPEAHFPTRPQVTAGHEPLLAVSASYAGLTLRHPPRMLQAARAYPLILLAGWLWDDTVDHNKESPTLATQMGTALSAFAQLLGIQEESLPRARQARLSPTNLDALRLLAQAIQTVDQELPAYSSQLRSALWVFLQSFAEKSQLRRDSNHSLNEYVEVRARCVGMYPCFALAYAIKATARGLAPCDMMDFASQPDMIHGAKLATLHCAAVNDLFSLYKDRQLENTVNFPSLLAPEDSVDGYWRGARATLDYVRQLVAEVGRSIHSLSGSQELKEVVSETWLEMMEGNVLFHLTVPRYKEGVEIVSQLTNPELSPEQSQRAFRTSFPPDARSEERGAVA